jgi:3-isopropylmalate/(R)-2-methylmalate dehydratase small subunit
VDTDELIPHRFLRKPLSAGYGNFLFRDKRYAAGDREDAGFILNQPPYRRAQVLVAGRNFGCGSTREGAVYALRDFGIRCVIAPSFADIFTGNCVQNGVLPVVLPEPAIAALCTLLEQQPGSQVTIDLALQTVRYPDGTSRGFEIEPSRKAQLLEGLDEIGITLKYAAAIARFENRYRTQLPWLAPAKAA